MGSSTYVGASHLEFEKFPPKKGSKLNVYSVINKNFGSEIGVIHWRGGWRQYVFQANPQIDMSRSCHKEIDKFIDKLMAEWRKKLTHKPEKNKDCYMSRKRCLEDSDCSKCPIWIQEQSTQKPDKTEEKKNGSTNKST